MSLLADMTGSLHGAETELRAAAPLCNLEQFSEMEACISLFLFPDVWRWDARCIHDGR